MEKNFIVNILAVDGGLADNFLSVVDVDNEGD